jgi:cytochrome c-type biogenesis protein CcmH/NrfG
MARPKKNVTAADALRLAAMFLKEKDYEGVAAAAEAATQRDPKSFEAWSLLGMARAKLKLYETAIPPYLKAAELRPDEVTTFTALGELMLGIADFGRSAQALRRACELDPKAETPAGRRARALIGRTIAKLRT